MNQDCGWITMLKVVLIDDEQVVLQGMRHLLAEEFPDYEITGSFTQQSKWKHVSHCSYRCVTMQEW